MLSNVFFLVFITHNKNFCVHGINKQTDSAEVRQVIQERPTVNKSWEQPAFQSKDSKPLARLPVGLCFFLTYV